MTVVPWPPWFCLGVLTAGMIERRWSTQPQDEGTNLAGALKYRNFRLFFFGQSISLIGTWMQQVAMIWLV